jgi:L-aminopeptidase/D-esterase-like protein
VFSIAEQNPTGTTNPTIVGALAADAVTEAIVRAVSKAEALGGLPAARDLGSVPARIK